MFRPLLASLLAAGAAAAQSNWVGGYALLNGPDGLRKLSLLSASPATLPITRLFLGFATPSMVYVPGSLNMSLVGLQLSNSADGGFAALKTAITTLQAAGVQTLLSLGGWNFNCVSSLGGPGCVAPLALAWRN